MKTFGFITVRIDSSRLPQKALMLVNNRRVIDHVIDRAKTIGGLDGLVICTSDRATDDVLEEIAREQGIGCFRGSLEDKLERFRGAAAKFDAEQIVLIDADDLFFGPELFELAVSQLDVSETELVKFPPGLVVGGFTFGLKSHVLDRACAIKDTTDTEMYELYLLEPGRFKVEDLAVADPIYFNDRIRLTLDYEEDFEFFCQVFEAMKLEKNDTSLREILEFIKLNPDLTEINLFRHRDYLAKRELMSRTKKIKS